MAVISKKRDSLVRRRWNLMDKHPYCHWCGKKLEYYRYTSDGQLPHDFPTIDHIYSREHYIIGNRLKGTNRKKGIRVLSCPKCNENRAIELQKKHLFIQRWKSGAFPYPFHWFGHLLNYYRKHI